MIWMVTNQAKLHLYLEIEQPDEHNMGVDLVQF